MHYKIRIILTKILRNKAMLIKVRKILLTAKIIKDSKL